MTMQDHADAGSTEREQAGTADTPLTQAVARAFSVATPGAIHILRDWHTRRPWWPTEQRFDCSPDKVVVTDCCLRRLPAKETICYLRCQEFPLGGYGDYQELESFPSAVYRNGEKIGERRAAVNWFSYASYYGPTWHIECNPEGERSCKQHRRFLRGLHLREGRYECY